MEWFWAAFAALLSAALFAAARHFWNAPKRWRERGQVSSGLGFTINANESPARFDLAVAGSKTWAGLAFAMATAGALIAIVWIWKAI